METTLEVTDLRSVRQDQYDEERKTLSKTRSRRIPPFQEKGTGLGGGAQQAKCHLPLQQNCRRSGNCVDASTRGNSGLSGVDSLVAATVSCLLG